MDCRNQEGIRTSQEIPQNQLTLAHRGSQRLNHEPGSLHGTDLGPLHICNSCAAGSSCGIFKAEAKLVMATSGC